MKKVLVVEDDIVFNKMLGSFLSNNGYQTLDAISVAQAREYILNNEAIDFALIDQQLPDGKGLDVLIELLEHQSAVKGIMMSRFQDDVLVEEFLASGAVEFLKKPLRPTTLLEVIKKHGG